MTMTGLGGTTMRRRCDHCVLGVMVGDGVVRLATLPYLLQHIERQRKLGEMYSGDKMSVISDGMLGNPVRVFTLDDYMNDQEQTDMYRFAYCPLCGHPIRYEELIDKHKSV